MPDPVLELSKVNVFYGSSHILHDINLQLEEGISLVIGRNGMGKTTMVSAIMGLTKIHSGEIKFKGEPIANLKPYEIARKGIGYVPQGRRIFSTLTVDEQLRFAAKELTGNEWHAEEVYKLFPRLKERQKHLGSNLSGGEQQMLTIGRALVINPSLLIMDEPSEGLAPVIIDQLIEVLGNLLRRGISILLIEQNLKMASKLSKKAMVMVNGQIKYNDSLRDLMNNEKLTKKYLGVGV